MKYVSRLVGPLCGLAIWQYFLIRRLLGRGARDPFFVMLATYAITNEAGSWFGFLYDHEVASLTIIFAVTILSSLSVTAARKWRYPDESPIPLATIVAFSQAGALLYATRTALDLARTVMFGLPPYLGTVACDTIAFTALCYCFVDVANPTPPPRRARRRLPKISMSWLHPAPTPG
jgi:hypothetical protein